MSGILIRDAGEGDLSAINEIYNYYVLNSTCTYQTEPETMDARVAWFNGHGVKHPIIVAVEGETVVGWGSLSRFHVRAAYSRTVENSVYIDYRQHRRGIGRMLLLELIELAKKLGHHTMIAGIDGEQAASVALHAGMGFTRMALLNEVGNKFGRWLDVIYMQRML